MSGPLLSILIPTIPDRHHHAVALVDNIKKQNGYRWEDVEILTLPTPTYLHGGPTVGAKRTHLVKGATGKYLCFLDDDETIAPNYIEILLGLCMQDKDICTFNAFYKLEKNYWGVINMRLGHQVNEQTDPARAIISRPPWHMCPVRSEFAKLYPFEDKNNAEDWPWMQKVLTHCKTEAYADSIIFQYNHGKHSEVDRIELANGKM